MLVVLPPDVVGGLLLLLLLLPPEVVGGLLLLLLVVPPDVVGGLFSLLVTAVLSLCRTGPLSPEPTESLEQLVIAKRDKANARTSEMVDLLITKILRVKK